MLQPEGNTALQKQEGGEEQRTNIETERKHSIRGDQVQELCHQLLHIPTRRNIEKQKKKTKFHFLKFESIQERESRGAKAGNSSAPFV
jgi:hypothetical protein